MKNFTLVRNTKFVALLVFVLVSCTNSFAQLKSNSVKCGLTHRPISTHKNEPVNSGMGGIMSISDQVFLDRNDNGIFDSEDWSYSWGMTLAIYEDANDDNIADGAALATTWTDGNGFFTFTGLTPGKYFIELQGVDPVIYSDSKVTDPDNDIDSDNNGQQKIGNTIKGKTITLTANGEPTNDGDDANGNKTYDFGVWKGNGLGDYVFLDANDNGLQDATEQGIGGVNVTLKDASGWVVETAITDANGYYYFHDIFPYGATGFSLTFDTPAGYLPAKSNIGSNDAIDSDPINGIINNITIVEGMFDHTFDAGFVVKGSIGDKVWYDTNADGIQGATELGADNITVKLYNNLGVLLKTTTTTNAGLYKFDSIAVTTATKHYRISFTRPLSFSYSYLRMGGDTTKDSDIDAVTSLTDLIALSITKKDRIDIDGGLKAGSPLPISFSALTAAKNADAVNLAWASFTELNFNFFEVQHSTDGINFTSIGMVFGKGNSSTKINYTFTDKTPANGNNYYRLKMVDNDNKFTISNVVMVATDIKITLTASVYPNPFTDKITATVTAQNKTVAQVMVFDNLGKKINQNQYAISIGTNKLTIDNLNALSSGIYFVKIIIDNKEVYTNKIIK
jgi:hypothetical protein